MTKNLPKWTKELIRSISINSQFIFWSNIHDIYPLEIDGNIVPLNLNDYLSEILVNQEYHLVLNFEPLVGVSMLKGTPQDFKAATGENYAQDKPLKKSLVGFIEMLEHIENNKDLSVAVIFNYTSRVDEACKDEVKKEFFYRAFRLMQNATPKKSKNSNFAKYNQLIFLLDKENDIPAWYITDNPKINVIPIPKPDFYIRESIIKNLSRRISGYTQMPQAQREENEKLFIEQTNGLYISEILSIIQLAIKEGVEFSNIGEAINMYKLGIFENEWAKIPIDKLQNSANILSQRVIGQSFAVNKVADILKRAYFNLSGSQYSKYSNRPKGVMFFAGPTGVGKTELAKAVTELVFGSENNYIRFDMSEFSQENANQRLVGAPPGYVGYETGGELTNAIKKNPFSVVLFDEIEKAHPRIMDIFLQILDDGRLTSGRGETVYLSETIIIFTSNLGVYSLTDNNEKVQNITMDMDYKTIDATLRNAIEEHFKYRLQRPEILNRIGENIVIFDYIREDVAKDIFNKMINRVLDNLREHHNINIFIEENALNKLQQECLKSLDMGGRGIGNQIENIFINPLSRALFENGIKANDTITIDSVEKTDSVWQINLSKKSI